MGFERAMCRRFESVAAWAMLVVAAGAPGCKGAEKPDDPAPKVATAADAGASHASLERKQKIEALVADLVKGKGLAVASVTCPDDAANHFTVKCPIVATTGEKIAAECRGDSDTPTCKLDVAVVDREKVVGQIRTALAKTKKKRRKTEITCPDGPLVKAVGDVFSCMATTKTKQIPVDVTVTDLDGRVRVALKS